jgi:hypothetical protein
MKPKNNISNASEKILPIRMSRVTPAELPVAVRDLADLLVEIAVRQCRVTSPSQPEEKFRG